MDKLDTYMGRWDKYQEMLEDTADTLEAQKVQFKIKLTQQISEFGKSIEEQVEEFKKDGPSSSKPFFRVSVCAARTLKIPQVNPGSRYRCGKSA